MSVPALNSAGHSVMWVDLGTRVHVDSSETVMRCLCLQIWCQQVVLTSSRILTVIHYVFTPVGRAHFYFRQCAPGCVTRILTHLPWLCFRRLCFLALLPEALLRGSASRGSVPWLCFQSLFAVAPHPKEPCMICTIVLRCHVTMVLNCQEVMMTQHC